MENTITELENFLLWFVQIEEIPMQSRRNFLGHVLKVKTLDEKAVGFIEETLEHLSQNSEEQAKELERQFNVISNLSKDEQNKESSIKENAIQLGEEKMMQLAVEFKDDFKSFQAEKNTTAETAEQDREESQVEALKAKLA